MVSRPHPLSSLLSRRFAGVEAARAAVTGRGDDVAPQGQGLGRRVRRRRCQLEAQRVPQVPRRDQQLRPVVQLQQSRLSPRASSSRAAVRDDYY